MKSKYGILVLIALFSLVLSGCGAGSKEVRFVDPLTPNRYYVIENDTFTFHYLDLGGGTTWATTTRDQLSLNRLEKAGTEATISGTVLRSNDGNAISFVDESGESKEYFSDGNFLGIKLFDVPEDAVFNDGKYFKVETEVPEGILDDYGSKSVEMDTSGTYSISGAGFLGWDVESGNYTVDDSVVRLTGTETHLTYTLPNAVSPSELRTLESDREDVWYYLDGSMYRCNYLKEN